MITLAEWKLIGITLLATFFISTIVLGIIKQIIARMQNKTKKVAKKKITHIYSKIDLCEYLTANMSQEFIGQRRALINELVRM